MPRSGCKMLRDKQAIIRLAGAAAALGCAGIAAWYLAPSQSQCNTSIWSLLSGSAGAAPPSAEQQSFAEPAPAHAAAEEAEAAVDAGASSSSQQQNEHTLVQQETLAPGVASHIDTDAAVPVEGAEADSIVQLAALSTDSMQQEQQQHQLQVAHQDQNGLQQHKFLQHADASSEHTAEEQQQQQDGEQQPLRVQTQQQASTPEQQQQQQQQQQQAEQDLQGHHQATQEAQEGQKQPQLQGQQHPQQQHQQLLQASKFEQQLTQWQQRQQLQADTTHALFYGSPRKQQQQQQQPELPPLSPRWSETQLSPRQQQQQQQPVLFPLSPDASGGPFLERTLSGNSSASSTPRSASMRQQLRTSINTTRKGPSLDLTMSSAAVARSLQMQYVDDETTAAAATAAVPSAGTAAAATAAAAAAAAADMLPAVRPLSASCALLCEQHCRKLQDIHGDQGETTALDIGCGTGGSCFELALSFSHVLGLDGDPLHVVAAKEMKERGQLEYFPVADDSNSSSSINTAAAAASSRAAKPVRRVSESGEEQHGATRAAKVSDDIDRDKVRFWQYALPELPPKLQPVDAVLVEDVEGRLGQGLARVLEQVPSLLNPEGVCVVVLDDSSSGSSSTAASARQAATIAGVQDAADGDSEQNGDAGFVPTMDHVRQRLEQQGLWFVKEQQLRYPLAGGSCGLARAGIWLQS